MKLGAGGEHGVERGVQQVSGGALEPRNCAVGVKPTGRRRRTWLLGSWT